MILKNPRFSGIFAFLEFILYCTSVIIYLFIYEELKTNSVNSNTVSNPALCWVFYSTPCIKPPPLVGETPRFYRSNMYKKKGYDSIS